MERINGKPTLIISYYFPPDNKTGGRRWAKFFKYLIRNNIDAYVLTLESKNKTGLWYSDIKNLEDRVIRIKIKKTPFFKMPISSQKITYKIKFKISYFLHQFLVFFTDSNSFNICRPYKKSILYNAEKIIREKKIENIITTGSPFEILYFGSILKKKFPRIKLITDYRDFWFGGLVYNNLNFFGKLFYLRKEKKVIKKSDIILAVNSRIINRIKKIYNTTSKTKLLEHGFDLEDFEFEHKNAKLEKGIRFIYAGSLYPKMENTIDTLIDMLNQISNKVKNVELHFYTFDNKYYEKLNDKRNNFKFFNNDVVESKVLFLKIMKVNYVLQLRSFVHEEQHFKSSKFFEQLFLKKQFIYIGEESSLSNYIEKKKLGFSILNNKNNNSKIPKILKNKNKLINSKDLGFIFNHSFEKQIKSVLEILQ